MNDPTNEQRKAIRAFIDSTLTPLIGDVLEKKLTQAALVVRDLTSEVARPRSEWHEDDGPVTWWSIPVQEPAWIGQPTDSDWPGYHTHWTPHPKVPSAPSVLASSNDQGENHG